MVEYSGKEVEEVVDEVDGCYKSSCSKRNLVWMRQLEQQKVKNCRALPACWDMWKHA